MLHSAPHCAGVLEAAPVSSFRPLQLLAAFLVYPPTLGWAAGVHRRARGHSRSEVRAMARHGGGREGGPAGGRAGTREGRREGKGRARALGTRVRRRATDLYSPLSRCSSCMTRQRSSCTTRRSSPSSRSGRFLRGNPGRLRATDGRGATHGDSVSGRGRLVWRGAVASAGCGLARRRTRAGSSPPTHTPAQLRPCRLPPAPPPRAQGRGGSTSHPALVRAAALLLFRQHTPGE